MALYYAWIGVIGGLSQLLGGWILQYSEDLSLNLSLLVLDPYSPLFLLGLILPIISLYFFKGVRRDSTVSMGTFAGFLLRGNPFMAVESMVRYHIAKDEETTVRLTERLGQTKSLLAVEELLASLADPRFNVRFEAIVAIGRTRPDEQLITALAQVLHGNDPALSVMAAWALGRIHDDRARDTLLEALDSSYRSIRAHSARSLATLGDVTAVPELLQRLPTEPDEGLRLAYAAALGQLQATEATPLILKLLADTEEETAQAELALSLARMVGE
jgi:HEAT repeat protein